MHSVEAAQSLSPEGGSQLHQGISLILSRWSALQLAVHNEWGGRNSRQKSDQLAADIFSWLTQSKELYIDDLEDMLDECMLTLNTEIADGSIEEVAEKIMIIHEECLEGNYQSIQRLKEANSSSGSVVHIKEVRSDGEEDDDDNDEGLNKNESAEMAVDAPEPQANRMNGNEEMMVDESKSNEIAETDGWTLVAPRQNRGRKN